MKYILKIMPFLISLTTSFLSGGLGSLLFDKQEVKTQDSKQAKELAMRKKAEEERRRLLYKQQYKAKKDEERKLMKDAHREEKIASLKHKHDLIKQWREKRKLAVKHEQYEGKFADLYLIPAWPVCAWRFEHSLLSNIQLTHSQAQRSFDDAGRGRNFADLAFGESHFKLQEILSASKLMSQGVLNDFTMPDDNFLKLQADTSLKVKAAQEEWRIDLDIARYVIGKDVTIGAQIPLVSKRHTLEMTPILSQQAIDNMSITTGSGGSRFRAFYAGNFDWFLNDLMQKKGMIFKKNQQVFGLGDISVYANMHLYSSKWEQVTLGCSLCMPSGNKKNEDTFWQPELGNGGFYQVKLFGGGLLSRDYNINPHFFFQLTLSAPTVHMKRVPAIKSFDGNVGPAVYIAADGTRIREDFLFGDLVSYIPGKSFTAPDTTLKEFADTTTKVRIAPGFAANIRIGNIFEKFIFRRGHIDVFYDIELKASDSVRAEVSDIYDVTVLKNDTARVAHKLGAEYSYQYDYKTSLRLSGNYVFAGINAPQSLELSAAFLVDF